MKLSLFLLPCWCCFLEGCHPAADHRPMSLPSVEAPTRSTQSIPGAGTRINFHRITDPAGKLHPFWIAETETTWDAYDPFAERLDLPPDRRASVEADPGPDSITRPTPPYSPPDRGWGHAGFPALGITANAAQQYCIWLSRSTRVKYRLPTVAEWRSACGAPPADLLSAAWCEENAEEKSHAVSGKIPNSAGLYDMFGNVAEWCTDGPGGKPVVCGGSFATPAAQLTPELFEKQTSNWQASQPNFPKSKWWLSDAPFVGFRVVRTEETAADLNR